MYRILCLVPGISADQLEHRVSILRSNIEILTKCSFDLEFHIYDYANIGLNVSGVTKVVTGSLGLYQVFPTYSDQVDDFDYVVALLDDVEIININLDVMIQNYNQHNMDIMSPSVTRDSAWAHEVMKTNNTSLIREVKFIELFCYIMTPKVYHRWVSIMTEQNTFGWGIDTNMQLLLNLKLFLFDGYKIKHHYINTVDHTLPLHQICVSQMREYNQKMGDAYNLELADFPDYTVKREFDCC